MFPSLLRDYRAPDGPQLWISIHLFFYMVVQQTLTWWFNLVFKNWLYDERQKTYYSVDLMSGWKSARICHYHPEYGRTKVQRITPIFNFNFFGKHLEI